MAKRDNKKIVNSFEKGLTLDTSPENQPKGTYRYALNVVTETEEGDIFNISTEESNELVLEIADLIILGKAYMGNFEYAILSTNEDESLSMIGIFNSLTREYTEFARISDLGFTKENQFDVIYRLRKGCERVIYFTDNNIKPLVFNFDNVEDYKTGLIFNKEKFFLQKSYNKVPLFRRIDVVEGGFLKPGAYIFAIQYLDEDLNPTDYANVSNRINIYKDKLNASFADIGGTSAVDTTYYTSSPTTKAIKLDLINLDENYKFYKIAIIKFNGDTGRVSEVTTTDKIPLEQTTFTYGGEDHVKITLEEVQESNFILDRVKNLTQMDNSLVASNISGKPTNYCQFQKYASKIKSRVVLKQQILTTLNPGNPKHPSVDLFSVGYMPGEIYSFGITYLFTDGTKSPVYHIPGLPDQGIDSYLDYNNYTSAPFRNMSTNNKLDSFVYGKRDNCEDYWGDDAWGNKLEGSRVRHHRFPSRQEANAKFVHNVNSSGAEVASNSFEPTDKAVYIYGIEFSGIEQPTSTDGTQVIGYEIVRQKRDEYNKTILDNAILTPIINHENFSSTAHIFPNFDVNNTPSNTLEYAWNDYVEDMSTKLNTTYRGLISPEFLFNGREYTSAYLTQIGSVNKFDQSLITNLVQDVQPGTSYEPDTNKKTEKDLDGYSLKTLSRLTRVDQSLTSSATYNPKDIYYVDAVSSFITDGNDKEIFNLSSDNKMGIVEFNEGSKPSVDLAKLPYVVMQRTLANPYADYLTARYFKQQLNPTMFSSGGSDRITLYGGDSFMCPFKFNNSFFVDIKLKKRETKSGFWKIVLGATLAIAGIVGAIFTLGSSLALTAAGAAMALSTMAVQYGLSTISAGIKQEKLARAYNELWEKGLKKTVIDSDVYHEFSIQNPTDDEIQWMNDVVEDLWIETNFNAHLRLDVKEQGIGYIEPIRPVTHEAIKKYMLNKLTVQDQEQAQGRLYKGFVTAEYYKLNADYDAMNEAKYHYSLPYEYDCCSDCREHFPHRVAYSQLSFSEELTDNFRKFLPNNYKDLPGETGAIMNTFVQNNRLYLHTVEALWLQPASYQERVTNEIVSFVGTGSLLEAPSQKIVDDATGNSVGLRNKWGAIQSKHGYFFPSANQKKVYNFNGKLEDLSLKGLSSWFKANLHNLADNPSNIESSGYTSAYDPQKERFLLTSNGEYPWTLSYCLKSGVWRSFHSYTPRMYFVGPGELHSWDINTGTIWKHNKRGTYTRFYGNRFNQELEYVSTENPMLTKITTGLSLHTTCKEFNPEFKDFVDLDTVSYSQVMLYNSKQTTGLLNIKYRDNKSKSFFSNAVKDTNKTEIKIGRADKDWYLNGFRDYVVDYTKPIFRATNNPLEINKVVNSSIIDYNKPWSSLQSFKDKYLVVKYIFNNFEDVKLTTRYSSEDFEVSLR